MHGQLALGEKDNLISLSRTEPLASSPWPVTHSLRCPAQRKKQHYKNWVSVFLGENQTAVLFAESCQKRNAVVFCN